MVTGICPSCKNRISAVSISPVEGNTNSGVIQCISHNCLACGVVLGVQVDPEALKTEIVEAFLKELRGN